VGTALVIALYLLANVAYLVTLPLADIQGAYRDRVASAAMEKMFPRVGEVLMAAAILVSTFGCNNGLILSGARAYYAMARDVLFYVLTIVGIFRLRRLRPDAPRPYRAIGYPVLPALYVVGVAVILGVLVVYQPMTTWPGLGIVLLGVPVYYFWHGRPKG